MNSGLLPTLPKVAAVCLRALACGGEVLPGTVDFFLDSQANGLESFRDIEEDPCVLEAPGADETDCERLDNR